MIAIFYIGLSRRREKCQLAGTFVVRISKNEQVNSFFSPSTPSFLSRLIQRLTIPVDSVPARNAG